MDVLLFLLFRLLVHLPVGRGKKKKKNEYRLIFNLNLRISFVCFALFVVFLFRTKVPDRNKGFNSDVRSHVPVHIHFIVPTSKRTCWAADVVYLLSCRFLLSFCWYLPYNGGVIYVTGMIFCSIQRYLFRGSCRLPAIGLLVVSIFDWSGIYFCYCYSGVALYALPRISWSHRTLRSRCMLLRYNLLFLVLVELAYIF